ncbi:MAG: 2Fe-2S iron-sulfur cluster-binding protein [Sphingobium sp.]|uniref:2Fe-2S iron-sulfur cluster-binding protein n=1 Tax=Sphingobium sp. TaxID=1912891 RepID=UPI0029B8D496|nr:2Fe-2S iron-sulfur cluster-binding protein [Sphingobium sp.]MDX3908556.1 2Fe-2S iron-sulfur cluster-binding protein [Sphingobium sp.]
MTKVTFISADGKKRQDVDAPAGAILLDVAQNAGQPLEGTCEGQMACSTCHVIVCADDFGQLPRATDAEEDMLDLAAAATRTSRLSCQIVLSAAIQSLTVYIPSQSHDMRGM